MQLFFNSIVIFVGVLRGEPCVQAEQFLEGEIEPQTGGGAAKEMVMLGKKPPNLAWILQRGDTDTQVFEGNSVAVSMPGIYNDQEQ